MTFVQAAVKSSYGRRPPTGAGGGLKVPGTAVAGPGGLISSRGRMPTAGQNMSTTRVNPSSQHSLYVSVSNLLWRVKVFSNLRYLIND